MNQLIEQLTSAERGPPSQKRLHLLNYIGCTASADMLVANLMVRHGMLAALARQVKDVQQPDM